MTKAKKFICIILSITLIATFLCSCGTKNNGENGKNDGPEVVDPETKKYGLHVEKDGTITLDGEPFYAFGTNWHGIFSNLLQDDLQRDYSGHFEALAEGVPVIRTMAGVFSTEEEWMSVYDLEATFAAMDKLVAYCEKYHIGLIMSLMWNYWNFYEMNGENPADCLGDPNAKGTQTMVSYVKAMVSRYKDSPAVFAWEVGNENLLHADLGDITTAQMVDYYEIFRDTVREIDPYRMIEAGDGCPRPYSYSLRNGDGWAYTDTEDMIRDTFEIIGKPMGSVSFHPYGKEDIDRVETLTKIAGEMNLAVIAGEFGAGGDQMSITKTGQEYIGEQNAWNAMTDKLLECGIQICLQWDFARCEKMNDEFSIELGFVRNLYQNEYQYERLLEINRRFIEEGKNKSADYWAKAEPAFYGKPGLELDGRTLNRSTNENDLLKDVSVLSMGLWEGTQNNHEGNTNANRTDIVTTLPDGTEGVVYRFAAVGTEGNCTFPNKLPVGKLIELDKDAEYTAKITVKATYSDGKNALEDGKKYVIAANKNDNQTEITADGEWHTYEYVFKTSGSAKTVITVGPESVKSYAAPGCSICVSDFELYKN